MKTLLLILTLCLSTYAVDIADYCTPNDGLDDGVCFQDAVDDLPNGGTIIVSQGTWDIKSPISFVTYSVANSFAIKGTKDSIIKPDLSGIVFYSGNQNQITFEGLTFVGDGTTANDMSYAMYFGGSSHAKVVDCQFYGLRASASTIFAGGTELTVEDTLFHGSAGPTVIETQNSKGLTIRNSEFLDYGNLNGTYYSKTPYGVSIWVKVNASAHPTPNANAHRGVIFENVRFDEGSVKTASFTNIRYVNIKQVNVNVSGIIGGAGCLFDNVKLAKVEQSMFGYSSAARPAMVLTNNSTVRVEGLALGGAVTDYTADGTSRAFIEDCEGC